MNEGMGVWETVAAAVLPEAVGRLPPVGEPGRGKREGPALCRCTALRPGPARHPACAPDLGGSDLRQGTVSRTAHSPCSKKGLGSSEGQVPLLILITFMPQREASGVSCLWKWVKVITQICV